MRECGNSGFLLYDNFDFIMVDFYEDSQFRLFLVFLDVSRTTSRGLGRGRRGRRGLVSQLDHDVVALDCGFLLCQAQTSALLEA